MWIGVLWAGLRVAMWITHVGGKFRHGLLEKSLIVVLLLRPDPLGKQNLGERQSNVFLYRVFGDTDWYHGRAAVTCMR